MLCIDDNPVYREILERLLTGWGLEVELTGGGLEGLAALRTAAGSGRPFEALLLDVQMPELDGLEVLRELQSDPELAQLPVILLSTLGSTELGADPLRHGAHAVLQKPIRRARLREQLGAVLHCEEVDPSRVADRTTRSERAAARDPAPRRRCLVVDDNRVNQMVARRMLEHLGWSVETAGDGRAAVDACEQERFDAVFMDCLMPVMDGYEAARRIRARETAAEHMPIVALTASTLDRDRKLCLEAGMDAFLTKPISIEDLRLLVDRLPRRAAA